MRAHVCISKCASADLAEYILYKRIIKKEHIFLRTMKEDLQTPSVIRIYIIFNFIKKLFIFMHTILSK